MAGSTKRRAIGVAIAIALVGLVVLFGWGDAPGRKLVFHLRSMECWKMPHDGGVAALGDSITAGTQDPELGLLGERSWFAQAVCHERVPYSYNAAIPSYTTEQVWGRLGKALERHPDAVVVLTGTNDVLNDLPLRRAVQLLRRMAARVRAAGAVPVFATIPPFNAARTRARRFNRLLEVMAKNERAPVINFYRILVGPDGRYKPALTVDGLHPSTAGAKVMAQVAAPTLRAAVALSN